MKFTGLFLTLLTLFQLRAATPNSPHNLRCYDKINPIGIHNEPYFGWHFFDANNDEIQSAYQIIVASSKLKIDSNIGDIWDSEKVESRMQNYVYFKGSKLSAARQYFWKIRTWDKNGNIGPYSESATFSTGLFKNSDWEGAKWIKRENIDIDDYTYYRKKIGLPNKNIKRAIAYISASHSYEMYINGKLVAKGNNHHYPQYTYYQSWDVSSFLKSDAENLFACLTHWYSGGQGRAKGERGLLMKVIVEYGDNTITTIGSDGSWKQKRATQWDKNQPVRNGEGIGHVEKIDSRKMIPNWNTISYHDSDWNYATEIGLQPVAPWTQRLRSDLTRVNEKIITPKSITQPTKGKYIIDLGKIYAGRFNITFEGGNSGDTIKMIGGFVLNNDCTVSKKINQQTDLRFFFIHNGKKAIFEPNVYLGLRYLQVENSPNVLTKNNVHFIERHYELTNEPATFKSSNSMLNDVWDLMIHSLKVGSQEGFVDTPTREKGTFLGDSWSQAVPCLSVMGDRVMNLRTLKEFIDSQNQYWPDGRLNAVYPNQDGARDIPDYTQAYLVWVWDYYMHTGNLEFLRSNYTQLKKIADYVEGYRNETTGLIHNLKGGKGPYKFGIIDWPSDMRYGYDMEVESRTVIDAYAYADFEIISQIAKVLGNASDSDNYFEKANQMKQAINTNLINDNGVYIDGIYADKTQSTHVTQHSNILPYALNIAPEEKNNQIVEEIKTRKMNVGMVCLRWLIESIGKANQGEHLIDLYTNSAWDGWAKIITQGATVTWESWNAIDKNESLSHPWGAVGLVAIQKYILGIQPLTPQHSKVQIKPLYFGDKLTFAKGTYITDKGDIYVDWVKNKNSYSLTVEIPDNMIARVYIPKLDTSNKFIFDKEEVEGIAEGEYLYIDNIGSGKHRFSK